MPNKKVSKVVAREILAGALEARSIKEAIGIRDESLSLIAEALSRAISEGLVEGEAAVDGAAAYFAAHKTIADLLVKLGVAPGDMEVAQAALLTITAFSVMAGSRDPSLHAKIQKIIGRKHASHARATKAAKAIPQNEIDRIILTAWDERLSRPGPTAPALVAKDILESVNRQLRELADSLRVDFKPFEQPDSLRRRYQQAKSRTAI